MQQEMDHFEENREELPWIIFELNDSQCAVNSAQISTILLLPENITPLPDAPNYVRGLTTLRGNTLPLLDLRSILGKETVQEQFVEFADMLELRKQDHLNWAKTLRTSVENNAKFTLATDPHQCAFGRWYDNYQPETETIRHQLMKIESPHEKLHRAAIKVEDALENTDLSKRDIQIKQIMEEIDNKFVKEIVRLLDETVELVGSSNREQVLVLNGDDGQMGLIVDKVTAVQQLNKVCSKVALERVAHSNYISGVAQDKDSLVLLLDEDALYKSSFLS